MVDYFQLITMVLAGLVALLIAVLLAIWLRKTSDMRHLKNVIGTHSRAIEQDAVLSDGIDGYFFVDYLLLLGSRIIIIKVVPNRGYIFGGEKIDEWTCVENRTTGKFNNPLKEINLIVRQIKQMLGFDAVEAYALFGSKSLFPKGVPEGVLQMAYLEAELVASADDDGNHEAARQAWDKLMAVVREDREQLRRC